MKYTYALLPRIPNSLKPEEKKLKLNIELMQKQAEGIVVTLKEAGSSSWQCLFFNSPE